MVRRTLLVGLVLLVAPAVAFGQATTAAKPKKAAPKIAPLVADYVYGHDSPRQVLDFWQAKSDGPAPVVVMIHGGGWVNGDKSGYGESAMRPFLNEGISVARINYRFIKQAMDQEVEPPVKACLYDAARALQTIRSKAKEWNVDPKRIGATGGSAGACTSLWLALHDDLAKADSNDPVERESSRLTCAAVLGAQTSLDPKQLREWIPNAIYAGHAFGFAAEGRKRPEEFELLLKNREKVLPWIKEYSPIEWVSKDDPPIYLDYPSQSKAPAKGQEEKDPTHSAMYGVALAEELNKVGVEAVLAYPGHEDTKYGSMDKFLIAKLKEK